MRVSLKHAKDSHQRSTWTAASNHGGRASGGAAWPEQAAGFSSASYYMLLLLQQCNIPVSSLRGQPLGASAATARHVEPPGILDPAALLLPPSPLHKSEFSLNFPRCLL